MVVKKLPFIIDTGEGWSGKNNISELVNLFLHIEPQGSKNKYILLNTDGFTEILDLPYTIYGIYEFEGNLYVITSNKLYGANTSGYWELQDISISDYVFITDNRNEIVFTDGNNAYSYKPSTNYLKDLKTETGFYDTDSVCFKDGYLIFNRKDTDQFFISNIYDTTFDATQYATAETYSDKLKAVYCNTKNLWLFGEKSIEIWYNSGNADFPFAKITGAVHSIGLLHKNTLAKIKDIIFFIGSDYRVYMTNGYNIVKVSSPSVDKVIQDNKDSNINAFCFNEYGHDFYVFTIENTATYIYDLTTQLWHSRKSTNADGVMNYWKINGVLQFISDSYIGLLGFYDTKLVELSINIYKEDNYNIVKQITTLPLNNTTNRIILYEVVLDMEVGLQDYDKTAYIYLQTAKYGGKKWSNAYRVNMGNLGEYYKQVKWYRLGQFRDVALKLYTYADIPIKIIQLEGRIKLCR